MKTLSGTFEPYISAQPWENTESVYQENHMIHEHQCVHVCKML